MLMPDVTEILDDPEVGGGEPFQVVRYTSKRTLGAITKTSQVYNLTGNIQPQDMGAQSSTVEDLMTENIVIYAKFAFQAGENNGGVTFYGADEILYDNKKYRVTRVNNWAKWGFSIAYASRVYDNFSVPASTLTPATPITPNDDPDDGDGEEENGGE